MKRIAIFAALSLVGICGLASAAPDQPPSQTNNSKTELVRTGWFVVTPAGEVPLLIGRTLTFGQKLTNRTFKRRNARGQIDIVVEAREAEFRIHPNGKSVTIEMRFSEAWLPDGTHCSAQFRFFGVPLP